MERSPTGKGKAEEGVGECGVVREDACRGEEGSCEHPRWRKQPVQGTHSRVAWCLGGTAWRPECGWNMIWSLFKVYPELRGG